jgi:hypothetical protein
VYRSDTRPCHAGTGRRKQGKRITALNAEWADKSFPEAVAVSDFPFSFVYGGKASKDFLDTWKRTVHEDSADPSKRGADVTLVDSATGLEIRAVCTLYLDTPR